MLREIQPEPEVVDNAAGGDSVNLELVDEPAESEEQNA
jgi:hypothetical protein